MKRYRSPIGLPFAVLGLTLAFPMQGAAQDVVLRSTTDADTTFAGTLIEMTEASYLIETRMGPVNVPRATFSCTGAACEAEGAAGPDAAAGRRDADAPVVWNVSLWGKRRAFTEHVERLAELVDERTDGRFRLEISYGGLSPSRENLDGIAAGKFEMAQFCAGYHPEKTPLLTVMELPFLGVQSLEMDLEVSQAVYAHPAVKRDLAVWNATLLMPSPQPQKNIVGIGQPPTSLGSFRGMTIRATGGVQRAIEALGAQVARLPSPEVASALAEGRIQATAMAPHGHLAFGTVASGSWWTSNLNPGTSNCPVVANTDALEALSAEDRAVLLSSIDEALEHYVDHYNGATMDAWAPALEENFIIELTIDAAIVAAIEAEVARPAAEAWIAENTALGLPAQSIHDLVTRRIREGS